MTITKTLSTSLIVGLLLLTLGLTTMVAFGQEESHDLSFTEPQEEYMMDQLQDKYGWDCSSKEACGEAFEQAAGKEGYDVWAERMHALMEEAGGLFKGVVDKYESVADIADKVNLEAEGEIASVEADKLVALLEKADLKDLASQVEEASNFSEVASVADDGGVVVSGFGEVTGENFADLVTRMGVEGAYKAVHDGMISQYSDEAAEHGFNQDQFAKYAEGMTEEGMAHFMSRAGDALQDGLMLGPPIEFGREGGYMGEMPPGFEGMSPEQMMDAMKEGMDSGQYMGGHEGDDGSFFDRMFGGGDYSGKGDHEGFFGDQFNRQFEGKWDPAGDSSGGGAYPYSPGEDYSGDMMPGSYEGGGDKWSSGGEMYPSGGDMHGYTPGDGGHTWGGGDTSAWTMPDGGWTAGSYDSGGGSGTYVDFSTMSPAQMDAHQATYDSGSYTVPTMPTGGTYTMPADYHPGALLYILLDLFR